MLKRLPIFAATTLIVALALMVRYDQIHNSEGKGYNIKCTQSSDPSATVGTLICTAEHSQKADEGKSESQWWHVFGTWPEGVTAVAIIFTLVAISFQTIYTRRAAEATEGSVAAANRNHTLAEDTAKRQLRAYICLENAEVVFPEGQLVANVNFKNCGQTPAYEVHGWIAVEVRPHPLQSPLPFPENIAKPKTTIGPGGTFGYPGRRKSKPFTPTELDQVGGPLTTLYVYGRVEYRDTFGESWYTNIRLFAGGLAGIRPVKDRDGTTVRWRLGPDFEGNDAT